MHIYKVINIKVNLKLDSQKKKKVISASSIKKKKKKAIFAFTRSMVTTYE